MSSRLQASQISLASMCVVLCNWGALHLRLRTWKRSDLASRVCKLGSGDSSRASRGYEKNLLSHKGFQLSYKEPPSNNHTLENLIYTSPCRTSEERTPNRSCDAPCKLGFPAHTVEKSHEDLTRITSRPWYFLYLIKPLLTPASNHKP